MNYTVLREYITAYKENFSAINKEEIYKWEAVQQFHDNWDIESDDFYTMLELSLSKTSNLLTSGNYFAKAMLLEIAKEFPEKVRKMFGGLYASHDLYQRITSFRKEFHRLNSLFEDKSNIYQDDRAIMVYLNLRYPDYHYFYKYEMSKEFAKRIEYPNVLKRGAIENIGIFTTMCELVKDELIKDQDLIKLHSQRILDNSNCYMDESYNILTQDFIYAVARHLTLEKETTVKVTIEYSVEERKIPPVTLKGVSFSAQHINHEKQNRKNKRIGDKGELFVVRHELRKVAKKYRKRVVHAASAEGDGLGYDIRSCDEKGEEIFIEVKTTTGDASTPFYLTKTELARSVVDSGKFHLYRVFNFNEETCTGDIHIYQGDLTPFCIDPVLYEVQITE